VDLTWCSTHTTVSPAALAAVTAASWRSTSLRDEKPGTWIGSHELAEEIRELRGQYIAWGSKLFPVGVNERTLANKVPHIVNSLMLSQYKVL
jgi:hypothetical protein